MGNLTQLKKGSDAGTVPPKVERLTSALDESDEGSSKRKGSPKANYILMGIRGSCLAKLHS